MKAEEMESNNDDEGAVASSALAASVENDISKEAEILESKKSRVKE